MNRTGDPLREVMMKRPGEIPEHAPDLLAFQQRAAAANWPIRLPSRDPAWDLPAPVDLKGRSLGDMVVRLRRAEV
jgi:hypothetical protein